MLKLGKAYDPQECNLKNYAKYYLNGIVTLKPLYNIYQFLYLQKNSAVVYSWDSRCKSDVHFLVFYSAGLGEAAELA